MGNPPTRIALLGSTGSIGRQTLDVVRAHPDRFAIVALAAGRNVELLAEQVREFRPSMVFCERPDDLRQLLGENLPQLTDLCEMVVDPEVDVVMSAIVGKGGLEPALAAAKAGKPVALANKEAMVMAGGLMKQAAREGGGELRPVDSEHSAIWQCLAGEDPGRVKKLIITASGGALRDLPLSELAEVGPAEALAHPTWSMGHRITIDSATLFNKGLEVIEAHWLFDIPYDRIDVLLHRESIIHSMVEMVDGSFKAHLSYPDMRQPIQFALTYPERLALDLPPVDFARMGSLNFGELDRDRYPCLNLVLQAGAAGRTYPAALAAADEEAVAAFLDGRLPFLDIPRLLADTLERHQPGDATSLEPILEADAWARDFARTWVKDR
ncbi:MAG: 1-deoxy-D-xylulose-5-phosphate reductoisomerase [Dehalococcoidia bacterium]